MLIGMLGMVSAETEIYKVGDEINLILTCSIDNAIPSSEATMNLTIAYPNGTLFLNSVEATALGSGVFNYTTTFPEKGTYYPTLLCVDGTNSNSDSDGRYEVTYIGKTLDEGKAVLYIGFLTLLILIFFLNFYGMGFLPKRNSMDEEGRIFSINYLKYFRNVLWMSGYFFFIAITFIASNIAFAFLEEALIAQTLFIIYRVSFGFAPVIIIVWIIWTFVSLYHDKQFQKMLNRGMFPQGNI